MITVIESPVSTRKAKIRRILAAVDFSPGGKAALQYADKLSRVFGASMTVINVAEVNDGWLLLGAKEFPLLDEQLRENHRRHLIDMVRSGGVSKPQACMVRVGRQWKKSWRQRGT